MAAKRRGGWFKWVVILVLIAGGVWGWRWRKGQTADKPVDFKTSTIARGNIVQAVTANGALSPVKNIQVGSQVSGIIQDLFVDFNSPVTNKQLLARIEPSTFQQNITSAEAELENAKAQLLYAELNHKRAKELRQNDLISPSEYDKTVADLKAATAVVATRDAALKRAQVDLERTFIYSPTDGIVIARAIDVGQTVAASFSAPTLFQIAQDLRQMRIEAMVSEADVGGVEENQEVNFTVDAFPNRQFRGRISQVRFAPVTNANVVNYTCVVDVNNADLKLRPGMTASASIVTGRRDNVVLIPNAALRFRPTDAMLGKKTNEVAKASGTNAPASRRDGEPVAASVGPGGGGPGPGGGGGFQNMTQEQRDEMRKRFESMTPEQREAMRSRFGGGGPGGGRSRGSAPEGPVTRTIYILDKSPEAPKNALKAVTIKTGLSDGTNTEVLEGLNEGDVVVAGVNLPVSTASAIPQGTSPFASPGFGGQRPSGGTGSGGGGTSGGNRPR